MNNRKKWLIVLVIIVAVFLMGRWAFNYWVNGIINPFGSASCGTDFDSGFKKAVADNNPSFCLTADLKDINQYRNFKGYFYCSVPRVGLMKSGTAIAKGDVSGCLQAMAEATQNVKACNLSPDKDVCYLRLANDTNNLSYCNLISTKVENKSMKSVCLNQNDQVFEGIIKSANVEMASASLVLCPQGGNCPTVGQTDYIINATEDTVIIDKNYNYTALTKLIGSKVIISGVIGTDGKTLKASNIKETVI